MASLALACMLDRRYRYEQPNLCWPSYGESKKIMIQETEAIITEKRKSTCSTSASATDQHVPTGLNGKCASPPSITVVCGLGLESGALELFF